MWLPFVVATVKCSYRRQTVENLPRSGERSYIALASVATFCEKSL